MPNTEGTANCSTCGALVWEINIPTKKTGNCWRCEVKRLNSVIKEKDKKIAELGEGCIFCRTK